jgi:chemotaxis signal transduction protein
VTSAMSLDRAAELRRDFDHSFQLPVLLADGTDEPFLAIRVLGDPYALRVTEVSGLFVDRPVTPLPGPLPELLGIAGFRGALTPVYCLARLLGYETPEPARRWLATIADTRALALAFQGLDGHVRLPRGAVLPGHDAASTRRFVAGVLSTKGALYSVIDTRALAASIEARALSGAEDKGPTLP